MKKTRKPRTSLSSRLRAKPHVEFLEDRLAPSVNVIENFEAGDLNNYQVRLRYSSSAAVANIGAHDGLKGLVKNDGYEWIIRNDPGAQVGVGQTISTWVNFSTVADGRAYFGFGFTPNGLTASPFSQASGYSLVLAGNTGQLILQNNNQYRFTNLGAVAVPGGVQANHPYRLEVQWSSASGANGIIGRLYDTNGTTLLATVTGTGTGITAGGIAFRSWGSPKWFDTVVVDTDSTATPTQLVMAGGGLDPTWTPGVAPPPRVNGPIGGRAPVPFQYTNVPGSGRDIQLLNWDQVQQAAINIAAGTVDVAGRNNSGNPGVHQISWGPAHFLAGGAMTPETPLLAQYMFRQRPGEATTLIGASDVKHFFSSAQATDTQHLRAGQTDVYDAIAHNGNRLYFTPGSEMDPVTGELHRASWFGALNADGVNQGQPSAAAQSQMFRLQMNIADLDPAQNPAGTRWYCMGCLWVAGDQNVANNTRWVEVAPSFNGSTFSFTYPQGTAGQLDFRTIPGLIGAFSVTGGSPSGATPAPVSTYQVTFSSAVDTTSFDPTDVVITGPQGSVPITGITQISSTVFAINFTAAQTRPGAYSVRVGPNILSTRGELMNQDGDGTPGEPTEDAFTGTFTIVGPRVTAQTPAGTAAAPVSSLRVTFSTAINPATFTPADIVSFTGPEGAITVTGVTPVSPANTQFDITFAPQSADGVYTLVLGPAIEDTHTNLMDQNQNGIVGEVPGDRYTATFTLGVFGPDGFGYVASLIPLENIDLEPGQPGVVTVVDFVDDDPFQIPLGSNTFRYYNTTYTGSSQLWVTPNGLITFGSGNAEFENSDLTSIPPQRTMAVVWDDWLTQVSATDRVTYRFDGLGDDTVTDRLVIEWQVFRLGGSATDFALFQAFLNLNTGTAPGAFTFNFVDLMVGNPAVDNGGSATTGIKDLGTQGANRLLINQDSSTNPFVQTGRAIRFTAAGVLQFSPSTYTISESGVQATVTVRRSLGNLGTVAVNYATSDGTATAGSDYTAVSGTLTFTAGQTTATFTVPITDDTSFENSETVNLTLSNPTNGAVLGQSTAVLTITDNDPPPNTLHVTSLIATRTGFIANFSFAFDPSVLSIYDGTNGTWGPADITLVGATTGPVRGSVVIDPSNTRFTFIRTGGLLPVDNYTITFRSDTNAFKKLSDGEILDGDANGIPGGDYVGTVNITSSTAPVINVPDVSRGAGQVVNVPASGVGLPLRLSNATNVTTASFTLRYNPNLLRITGGTAVPAGASATVDTTTPGTALITFTSPVGITAGPTELVELVRLTADVPATAPYRAKAVLDLDNVMVNGAAALDDDGLDLAAYLGDVSGNGNINSTDATFAQRIGVGLGTGADRYPLTDIVVLADANGDSRLSSLDAAHILRAAVGLASSVPATPMPPVQLTQAAIDPLLIIGKRFRGQASGLVTVPVVLDFSEGLESVDLAISYDTSRLEVVAVERGSLTEDFDLFLPNVDPVAGTIRVGAGRTVGGLEGAGAGSVLLITFRIKADAPVGRAIINLRRDVGSTLTQLNDGDYDLVPAPSNEAGDFLDGFIDVLDGRRETLKASEAGFDLFDLAGRRKNRGAP